MNSFPLTLRILPVRVILAASLLAFAIPAFAQRSPLKAVSPAARQLISSGKYAEALPELNQLLLVDSLNVDLLSIRAECHSNLPSEAHARAALLDFNKALRYLPENAALRAERGLMYSNLGQYPEAISDLNFALDKLPTDAALVGQRGYCYLSINRLPDAITDLTRAIALDHTQPRYGMMLCFTHMVNGSYDLALKAVDKVVAKNKSSEAGYVVRATVRQRLNDLPGARLDISNAQKINPTDSTVMLVSAFILEQAGEKVSAEKRYTEILSQAKSKVSFYSERGDLYLQTGDIVAAEEDWKKAVALGSNIAKTRLAAHYQPHPK